VNPREKWIIRSCPASVSEELWHKANAALHSNQIVAMAHAKNQYLLRGIIRCGLCGLTFIGTAATRPNGKKEFRYRCNGAHGSRGLYGKDGQKCPSQSVRGAELESAVWQDLETFLSKPGLVIRQLQTRFKAEATAVSSVEQETEELAEALRQLKEARNIALRQLTRQTITESEYDQQLLEIKTESTTVECRLEELRQTSAARERQTQALKEARSLLEELRESLETPLTFDQRRRVVEALVESITVTPGERNAPPHVKVRYAFEPHFQRYQKWARGMRSALNDTGTGSLLPPA
jgi:site-specific DNA recombinase